MQLKRTWLDRKPDLRHTLNVVDDTTHCEYNLDVGRPETISCTRCGTSVTVKACTTIVPDVAVYIVDPLGQRAVWSIGYFGGLDRGISFGHRPQPAINLALFEKFASAGIEFAYPTQTMLMRKLPTEGSES